MSSKYDCMLSILRESNATKVPEAPGQNSGWATLEAGAYPRIRDSVSVEEDVFSKTILALGYADVE